ncbi:MAG: TerB family tellurite resistance protein [Rhodothermales bacterium]
MESPSSEQRILRNLALIYIALAHGADQDLDDAEMDVIASRLHEAQSGVSDGTVLRAVKGALEDYTQEDAPQRIDQAVRHLREAAPPTLRRRILKDLTDIGKADDRFLFAEAGFIGQLMDAWKEDTTDATEDSDAMWSVFGPGHQAFGWTPIHDLVLIYVTLAHQTDDNLSRVEIEAIITKINEWLPNADEETLRHVLNDVLNVYAEESEEHTLDAAIEAVKEAVPAHQRAAVLDDLRYIANADGVLLVEERVMIEKLATAWGFEME